jgi:hypothetical protein
MTDEIPDDRYIQIQLADVWLKLDQKHGFVLGTSTTPYEDTAVYTVVAGGNLEDEMPEKDDDPKGFSKKSQVGPPHLETPKGKEPYWAPAHAFDPEDVRAPVKKDKDAPSVNPELGGSPSGIREPLRDDPNVIETPKPKRERSGRGDKPHLEPLPEPGPVIPDSMPPFDEDA